MNESKHTPGPWTIKSRNNPHEWDVIKGGEDDPWFIAAAFDGAEGRASLDNARLIAAAPDLLEACRAAYATHSLTESEAGLPSLREVGDMLACAIAKAEGRT